MHSIDRLCKLILAILERVTDQKFAPSYIRDGIRKWWRELSWGLRRVKENVHDARFKLRGSIQGKGNPHSAWRQKRNGALEEEKTGGELSLTACDVRLRAPLGFSTVLADGINEPPKYLLRYRNQQNGFFFVDVLFSRDKRSEVVRRLMVACASVSVCCDPFTSSPPPPQTKRHQSVLD